MTALDVTAPEWSTWTPVSGALAHVKNLEPSDLVDNVNEEDSPAGLPILATNDRGEFIRSDFRGIWYRCNWVGQPLPPGDPDTTPMPGVLKLRVQLTERVTYTVIAAAVLVWHMPNVGVCYKKITEMHEWPDGTRKIGNEWHAPHLGAWLDSSAREHCPAV